MTERDFSLRELLASSNTERNVCLVKRVESAIGGGGYFKMERIGQTKRYRFLPCDEEGCLQGDDCRPRHISPWVVQFKEARIKTPGGHFVNHVMVVGQNCLQTTESERTARE